jgi:hypothetical protein
MVKNKSQRSREEEEAASRGKTGKVWIRISHRENTTKKYEEEASRRKSGKIDKD